MFGKRVACTVNPSLELENEDNIPAAQEKKQVLVIGGGPAGMEAAFVAKKRGHEVVLCEKSDSLGGLVKLAAVPIAKQELTKVIQYMERKLIREGVEIRLNCEVTEEMLKNDSQDMKYCGNGCGSIVVNAFTAFKHCVTADDILAGKAFAGRKVVVIGGGSGRV